MDGIKIKLDPKTIGNNIFLNSKLYKNLCLSSFTSYTITSFSAFKKTKKICMNAIMINSKNQSYFDNL